MTNKINFIDAHGGGIRLYNGFDNLKGWSGTAKGIAYTLRTVGLADRVMDYSSMDFASEYGFENDDAAIRLWNEALDLYNWEVNGVAG